MVNYKVKKKDDIDNITHFFKELLIDTFQDLFSDIDIINKLFLT